MNAAVRALDTEKRYRVRAHSIIPLAEGVISITMTSTDGEPLPSFEAGAHIEVFLPNGLGRCYSLINPLDRSGHYQIAVQRDRASRGGSAYLCDALKAGTELNLSAPRNHFRLVDAATHVRLVAGGIGVTPLWAMAQVLASRKASWDLFYSTRSRVCAAFLDRLQLLAPTSVTVYFDDEHEGRPPNLEEIVKRRTPPDSHFYCCGPGPMLKAFEQITRSLRQDYVHTEYFTAAEEAARSGGFAVELRRSGRTIEVAAGQSILDALMAAGVNVRFMCTEGVCGECETKVIAGEPDHRDSYLTEEEKRSNKTMMICCSGAKGDKLVLDI